MAKMKDKEAIQRATELIGVDVKDPDVARGILSKFGVDVGETRPKNENIFDKLEKEAFRSSITPKTKKAQRFFRKRIKDLGTVNRKKLLKDEDRVLSRMPPNPIGQMFMYFYDAKWKRKLPFWDRFPLVIPIDMYNNGWLGLNLHYLDLKNRTILFNKLLNFTTNNSLNEKTRLRVSYQFLKGVSGLEEFYPCVKRYLRSHVDSRVMRVPAYDWPIAMFLPVASWQKASKYKVHRWSRDKFKSKRV